VAAPADVTFDSSLAFEAWDPTAPKKVKAKKGDAKAKSKGHAPSRPPNAFILFRQSFIKQGLVTSKVELNSSAVSKIVGKTWRMLTADQRVVWEAQANIAQAEFRAKHPQYTVSSFAADAADHAACPPPAGDDKSEPTEPAPVRKRKRKAKEVAPKDEQRCERIAQLIMEGHAGEDLERKIAEFDAEHTPPVVEMRFEAPLVPTSYRRSSSAPAIAEAGEQSRFYYPSERSTKKKRSADRSSSSDTPCVKDEATSPNLAAAELPAYSAPPVQVNFNMDMFSADSNFASMPTPTDQSFVSRFDCVALHALTHEAEL
jgi:hypothetical protein